MMLIGAHALTAAALRTRMQFDRDACTRADGRHLGARPHETACGDHPS